MKQLSQNPKAIATRKRYYDAKARGLCVRCKCKNTRAVPGYAHCQRCLDHFKVYEARQRAERRATHQCIDCGRDLEPSQRADNRDRCSFCEDKHDAANYNYRM